MRSSAFAVFIDERGGGGGGETRPGTEKRCSHNFQSDPPGSGFNKGRGNFPQQLVQRAQRECNVEQ